MTSNFGELNNHLGINCEYPGQTMMIALAILLNFDHLGQAKETGSTYPKALESRMIPGAGDGVHNALEVLERGIIDNLSAEDMIKALHDCWREYAGHQPAYADRVMPGLAKAKPFEIEFVRRWHDWQARSAAMIAESA